jgi:predicted porin
MVTADNNRSTISKSGDSTMKLRHFLIAAGCLTSSSAFAQSSVTLYGVLDTGVEYVTHANAAGNSILRTPNITGTQPSRWGLRGSEDLGGGLHAVFTLESGFNVANGALNQGGREFGRQAFVGLDSKYGLLSFGRQYSMTYWVASDANIMGPDIYGMGSLDSYIPNARSDNTIAYKGTFSGVTVGATYSDGRDSAGTGNSPGQGTCAGPIAGNALACRQWSAMLRYDNSMFGVATAYDQQRGGTGALASEFNGVAALPLASSGDTDTRIQANGWFLVGNLKVGGGWLGRRVTTASATETNVASNMYYLGASYPVTPAFTLEGEIYRMVDRQQDTRASMAAAAALYALSKRTTVYLQGAFLENSRHAAYTLSSGGGGTTPGAGMNQTGVMVGIRETF